MSTVIFCTPIVSPIEICHSFSDVTSLKTDTNLIKNADREDSFLMCVEFFYFCQKETPTTTLHIWKCGKQNTWFLSPLWWVYQQLSQVKYMRCIFQPVFWCWALQTLIRILIYKVFHSNNLKNSKKLKNYVVKFCKKSFF